MLIGPKPAAAVAFTKRIRAGAACTSAVRMTSSAAPMNAGTALDIEPGRVYGKMRARPNVLQGRGLLPGVDTGRGGSRRRAESRFHRRVRHFPFGACRHVRR